MPYETSVVADILKGAIDMHIHAGPDEAARLQDCIEVAEASKTIGLQGFVIKSLFSCSAEWAYLVNKMVVGVQAYGSVVLDHPVGGLNIHAVNHCLKMGGKVVWMPVRHSLHAWLKSQSGELRFATPIEISKAGAISLLDEKGEVKESVVEILQAIAKADVCLATGHTSPAESLLVIKKAREIGVKKILVTHPCAPSIGATLDEQKEMAREGAYIEHVLSYSMPQTSGMKYLSMKVVLEAIRELGVGSCIIATDFGRPSFPTTSEGIRTFVTLVLEGGFSKQDVETMVKSNPRTLLGI